MWDREGAGASTNWWSTTIRCLTKWMSQWWWRSLNFRYPLLFLVGAFLAERKQCVTFEVPLSAWISTTCGVLQGCYGCYGCYGCCRLGCVSRKITAGESCSVSPTELSRLQEFMDICMDVSDCWQMCYHTVPGPQACSSPFYRLRWMGNLSHCCRVQSLGVSIQILLRCDAYICSLTAKASSTGAAWKHIRYLVRKAWGCR